MPKLISHIRREPIDRIFVGIGTSKVEGREEWIEATEFIKGMTYAAAPVTEKDGDGGMLTGMGYLVTIDGEPAQNTAEDYAFYFGVMNGRRNVAIVTGKGPSVLIRLFRLHYIGGGKWEDNRISIVTGDKYDSSMDKAQMKVDACWVRHYELYTATDLIFSHTSKASEARYSVGKLSFKILQSAFDLGVAVPNDVNHIGS